MTNWRNTPCVTSQSGPWDDNSDALYELAEDAWNECWPPEPTMSLGWNSPRRRSLEKEWLIFVFTNIVSGYNGPLSDIGYHLGEFSTEWIEKKAEAILEDAREAEASARADWMEDR